MKVNRSTLAVASPAFAHGTRLPDRFTSHGEGISPPLTWTGAPEGTQSFAILSQDADAPIVGGFAHWMIWDIPGDATSIAEGDSTYPSGEIGIGRRGWFPPSPLPGHGDHFYYFHLYALDQPLDLEPGCDLATFHAAVEEHVLGQARIVGLYSAG